MDNNMEPEKTTATTVQQSTPETMFCSNCGNKIAKTVKLCPHCGAAVGQNQSQQVQQPQVQQPQQPQIIIQNTNSNVNTNQNTQNVNMGYWKKPKNKWVALLLCIFLGFLGMHKFYEGRIGTGILYMLTCGLFCIGWIIDIFALLMKPNFYYV